MDNNNQTKDVESLNNEESQGHPPISELNLNLINENNSNNDDFIFPLSPHKTNKDEQDLQINNDKVNLSTPFDSNDNNNISSTFDDNLNTSTTSFSSSFTDSNPNSYSSEGHIRSQSSTDIRSNILSKYSNKSTLSLSAYSIPNRSSMSEPNSPHTTSLPQRTNSTMIPQISIGSSLPGNQVRPHSIQSPGEIKQYGDKNINIEPHKKVIKDQVVDDLVQVSRNFLPVIKGGTLEKLIERLTFESSTEWDNDYIDVFLLTYKSFISSKDLLDRLFERYKTGLSEIDETLLNETEKNNIENKQKIIRIRVTNVLKRWITDHFHDFANDETLLETLRDGLRNITKTPLLEKALLEQIIKKDKAKTERHLMFSTPPPPPIIPKGNTFTDFDPTEFARQVCLYQQQIYQSIHPKEALNQSWNKHKERAPNIIRMINFFNTFSRWVSDEIVSKEIYKERCKTMKKILQVLEKLREFNNFDAVQAILAGLGNSSVYRLKLTWDKIRKKKVYQAYTQCKELMDTSGSYSNYRRAVETSNPPIIPYLGVYLTDLTFIEDGNSDYLVVKEGRTDIINFDKLRKVAAVIKDICIYQQTPYSFNRVEVIQQFLDNLNPRDEKELFRISKEIEPTGTVKKKNFLKKTSVSLSNLFEKKKKDDNN